jgi:hypothetical protein
LNKPVGISKKFTIGVGNRDHVLAYHLNLKPCRLLVSVEALHWP